jgi:hypothetical protein
MAVELCRATLSPGEIRQLADTHPELVFESRLAGAASDSWDALEDHDVDLRDLVETALAQFPTADSASDVYTWSAALEESEADSAIGISITIDSDGTWRSLQVSDTSTVPVSERGFVWPC